MDGTTFCFEKFGSDAMIIGRKIDISKRNKENWLALYSYKKNWLYKENKENK